MSNLKQVEVICPSDGSVGHKAILKVDIDYQEPRKYYCQQCPKAIWAQSQKCECCSRELLVIDEEAFAKGWYVCVYCRGTSKLVPWYPPKKGKDSEKPKKVSFVVTLFKKLIGQKGGPVLAHDSSLSCPHCDMDSVFWEIGNGARKICSMCDQVLP